MPSPFSPEGRLLATASFGGELRLWSVATGQELHDWIAATCLHALTFSPDGRTLAAIGVDDRVRCWDQATLSPLPDPRK